MDTPKNPELVGLEAQRDALKVSIAQREAGLKTSEESVREDLRRVLDSEKASLAQIEARIKTLEKK